METDGYVKGYHDAYQQASDTVGQVNQVVMLYDGAINFIKQAKEAIVEKNHEKRYNLINKAIAIVTGLNSCLNFTEETEETAKALDEFYSLIDIRLLYIQCDDSLESCDKVIADLKVMRNAWVDVAQKTSEENIRKNMEENQIDSVDVEMEEVSAGRPINDLDSSSSLQTELQINA